SHCPAYEPPMGWRLQVRDAFGRFLLATNSRSISGFRESLPKTIQANLFGYPVRRAGPQLHRRLARRLCDLTVNPLLQFRTLRLPSCCIKFPTGEDCRSVDQSPVQSVDQVPIGLASRHCHQPLSFFEQLEGRSSELQCISNLCLYNDLSRTLNGFIKVSQ